MYKIKRSDVKILINMRKRSLGCSYEDAKAQVMDECELAEDIRHNNQKIHSREYMREYSKKRRAKLKADKIITNLVPA